MKKPIIIIFFLLTLAKSYSQSPKSFKYQAVLRDQSGVLLLNTNVSVQISILKGSVEGTSAYIEKHTATTNMAGIINLEIGKGTLLSGSFTTIEWGKSTHFIKVEMDPKGGSAFELVGVAQLLSVPYALYAEKSGDEKWGINASNDIYYTGGKVGLGTTTPVSSLDIQGVNSSLAINKIQIKSTDSENKGRLEIKSDPADQGNVYSTSLDRLGDFSEDLIFGLQQPVDKNSSWNIFESWRGAGLMVSASGPDLKPLTFGIDRIEKARLASNGNFGIGTLNPMHKLDVNGAINATSLLINGQPINQNTIWSSTGNDISYNAGQVSIGTSSQASRSSLYIDTPLPTSDNNKSNGLFINATDVSSRGIPLWIRSNTSNLAYSASPGGTLGRFLRFHDLRFAQDGMWDFGIDQNNSLYIMGGSSGDITEKFTLRSNGNIGIGKTDPSSKLDVNGGVNATQYLLNGSPVNFSANQIWNASSGNISYSAGKVGIGTTTPLSNLDIQGLNSTSGLFKTQFKGTESEGKGRLDIKNDPSDLSNLYSTSLNRFGDSSEDLVFGLQQPIGNYSSWNILESWRGAGLLVSASGPDLAPLVFGIDRIEKARLDINGNFGIGTSNPKSKLQVESGDIYINSVSSGVIMKSPNGQCWRMTVSNTGTPVFSSVTCP